MLSEAKHFHAASGEQIPRGPGDILRCAQNDTVDCRALENAGDDYTQDNPVVYRDQSDGQPQGTAAYHPWVHRYAVCLAVCTFALIVAGAMVTSTGSGLSVPDWPTTYGYNMFTFPLSKWVGGIFYEHSHRLIASGVGMLTIGLAILLWRFEQRRWLRRLGVIALGMVISQGILGGITVQFLLPTAVSVFHACLAQAFFCTIVAIAVFTSRAWCDQTPARQSEPQARESVGIPRGTGFQPVCHYEEHGLEARATCQSWGFPADSQASAEWRRNPRTSLACARGSDPSETKPIPFSTTEHRLDIRTLSCMMTCVIFVQLLLGAVMRHTGSGLAVPDFPLAYGQVFPDLSEAAVQAYNVQRQWDMAWDKYLEAVSQQQIVYQLLHRGWAIVVSAAVLLVFAVVRRRHSDRPDLRRSALMLVFLLAFQLLLGASTIWSGKAAIIASGHVAVGALTLGIAWRMTLQARLRIGAVREAIGFIAPNTPPSPPLAGGETSTPSARHLPEVVTA